MIPGHSESAGKIRGRLHAPRGRFRTRLLQNPHATNVSRIMPPCEPRARSRGRGVWTQHFGFVALLATGQGRCPGQDWRGTHAGPVPDNGTVSILVKGQSAEAAVNGRDNAAGAFEALGGGISSIDIASCMISLETRAGAPDATADFHLPTTHPRLIL
jgi:hypothetical protein